MKQHFKDFLSSLALAVVMVALYAGWIKLIDLRHAKPTEDPQASIRGHAEPEREGSSGIVTKICQWLPDRQNNESGRDCLGPDSDSINHALTGMGQQSYRALSDQAVKDGKQAFQVINARPPVQVALAKAIAKMEGFGAPGTLATRLHNPGMLAFNGQDQATRDVGICGDYKWSGLVDSEGHVIYSSIYACFPTDAVGWAALHKDIAAKWPLFNCNGMSAEVRAQWPFRFRANDECTAYGIAYNWTSPPSSDYADKVVAEMKRVGGLK